jgi:quercetin dioxygenase-like cupin family protein
MNPPSTAKTPGAIRAGGGKYLFELAKLNRFEVGADYSTTSASCIEGDRTMLALARMAAGTGADAHSHPNEQWIFVLEGTLVGDVAGTPFEAKPGGLVYIPPNAVHCARATPDSDVVFLTAKDNSHTLHGIKADREL